MSPSSYINSDIAARNLLNMWVMNWVKTVHEICRFKKISNDPASTPGHWKTCEPKHEERSPFHFSKERAGFPVFLRDFLSSFTSSFAQQDLPIFLRHHPKLLWQWSCLLIKGEWVSCHEKLRSSFFHLTFCVAYQVCESLHLRTLSAMERNSFCVWYMKSWTNPALLFSTSTSPS